MPKTKQPKAVKMWAVLVLPDHGNPYIDFDSIKSNRKAAVAGFMLGRYAPDMLLPKYKNSWRVIRVTVTPN